jgi:hypothetical protein
MALFRRPRQHPDAVRTASAFRIGSMERAGGDG